MGAFFRINKTDDSRFRTQASQAATLRAALTSSYIASPETLTTGSDALSVSSCTFRFPLPYLARQVPPVAPLFPSGVVQEQYASTFFRR